MEIFRVAVKLGEHNLDTEIDCADDECADPPQIIYTKSIVVPKEYSDENLKHDVAIIKLLEPAKMTKFVSPVCLPQGELLSKSLVNDTVEVC